MYWFYIHKTMIIDKQIYDINFNEYELNNYDDINLDINKSKDIYIKIYLKILLKVNYKINFFCQINLISIIINKNFPIIIFIFR